MEFEASQPSPRSESLFTRLKSKLRGSGDVNANRVHRRLALKKKLTDKLPKIMYALDCSHFLPDSNPSCLDYSCLLWGTCGCYSSPFLNLDEQHSSTKMHCSPVRSENSDSSKDVLLICWQVNTYWDWTDVHIADQYLGQLEQIRDGNYSSKEWVLSKLVSSCFKSQRGIGVRSGLTWSFWNWGCRRRPRVIHSFRPWSWVTQTSILELLPKPA